MNQRLMEPSRWMICVSLVLVFLVLSPSWSPAQTPTNKKAKQGPKPVSLDTILSCAEDAFVQNVFKTNLSTMRKLHISEMILHKDDSDYRTLRYAGFRSTGSDPLQFGIMPFHPDGIPVVYVPFCDGLTAYYLRQVDSSLPYMVVIDVDSDYWTFEPNELFAHADQFTFKSGVFSNTTRVFLSATKGHTEIQFVSTPKGLILQRVFITIDR